MKNKIFAAAGIVTALSVAERSLGFLYRILLSRFIGAEGLGLYQVALSLFGLFLTIGTGGLPITVSRMISKSKAENNPLAERRAVSAGVVGSILLTLPVCLLFWAVGDKMHFLFSDARAFSVFRVLLLGLVFTSVYAVFRGYFWGNKNFLTPSLLEIGEEIVMVLAGILLLRNVRFAHVGAVKAAWAVIISYGFSFTASLLCFLFHGGKFTHPKKTLKPLLKSTAPITAVRAGGSLVNSAVAVLLPLMLVKAGYSTQQSIRIFGVLSGMVIPVLFIPSTLIGSIALVLVPELAEDYYKGNTQRLKNNLSRGFRFSFYLSCALTPILFVLGNDLGRLAFSNAQAGQMISVGSFLLLPMSLSMITTSMLNSLGFEKQTFIYYFIGAAGFLLCVLFLPNVCGGYAYLWGLGISFVISGACNVALLVKKGLLFQKQGGHVRVEGIFPCLFLAFFIGVIGQISAVFLRLFFSATLATLFTALLMSFIALLGYVLLGIVPLPTGKRKKGAFSGKSGLSILDNRAKN